MSFDYASYEHHLAAVLLVLSMLGLGATLRVDDFWRVLRVPKGICLVLAIQLAVAPWIAIGIAHWMSLPEGIAVGMLLVAALPGGAYSNLLTHLGRGNVSFSVAATTVSTLGCIFTTPLVLEFFGRSQLPDDFAMPAGQIGLEIFCYLLGPLVFGMWVNHRFSAAASLRFSKWCLRGSLVALALIVVGSLSSGRLVISQYGLASPAGLILFGVVLLAFCYAAGFAAGMIRADSFTLATEVTVRNGSLGLLLKASLFPAAATADPLSEGVLYAILFYSAASLVIVAVAVVRRRWRQKTREY